MTYLSYLTDPATIGLALVGGLVCGAVGWLLDRKRP